jgi:hypothetical protein
MEQLVDIEVELDAGDDEDDEDDSEDDSSSGSGHGSGSDEEMSEGQQHEEVSAAACFVVFVGCYVCFLVLFLYY